MPIYEYRCQACGKTQEVLQKISDKPLKKCPLCSGALEKLISRSSFQLKGTGWYQSDYGRKSTRDESASSASGTNESGKDDSKSSSSKDTPAGEKDTGKKTKPAASKAGD